MSGGKELKEAWESKDALWFTPSGISAKTLGPLVESANQGAPGLVWFSSSGSTSDGGLKFIGHRRTSLERAARAANIFLQTTSQDHVVNILPLFHVGGFSTWLRAKVGRYQWTHLDIKWSASKFIKALDDEKATLTSMVPTQIHDVVAKNLECPSSLRAVLVGGGRLSVDLYQQARTLGWPLLPSYGLTEVGSQVATAKLASLKSKDYPKLYWLSHIDRIGKSKQGQFFIESESSALAEAVLNREKVFSLELKTRGGRLLIDDELVVNSKARTLKVLGRRNRVLKVKGELVSLDGLQLELEDFLSHKFPKLIAESFVIHSVSHPREENELILLLERGADAGLASFQLWKDALDEFNSRTARHKYIKRFEFIPQFERTSLGKIKTGTIKSAFQSNLGQMKSI